MTEQKLSKLLDEKLQDITTNIFAIEARMAGVEDKMPTRVDLVKAPRAEPVASFTNTNSLESKIQSNLT